MPLKEHFKKQSIWAWPDATVGQRASAFVLEGLIVGALGSLVQVVFSRFYDSMAVVMLQIFLYLTYFVVLQMEGRRTLGQKLVGIRLIGLHVQEVDEGLKLGAVLMREALWFPLSFLALGLGVVMMYIRKDRMALYDLLARTRLVAMSPEPASVTVRKSVILGFLAAIGLISSFGVFALNQWTTYPLRRVVHDLKLLGYQVGRVKGSIASGFVIERLAFETDEVVCEFNGVRFVLQPVDTVETGDR